MKLEAMLWMLILASLALAIVSRKYRKYGLVVLGIAAVTVAAVIVLVRENEILPAASPGIPAQQAKRVDFEQSHVEKLDKEEPDAKDRIGVSEIRFDQIRPSGDSEPGTIASIRARLYNDSARFTLTDFAYYLAVQDCVDRVCTTIYDQRGLESTMVPAAQARDVMIEIRAQQSRGSPPFKVLGTPKIILSPTGTRAYNSLISPD
jgi:hypothetical protein